MTAGLAMETSGRRFAPEPAALDYVRLARLLVEGFGWEERIEQLLLPGEVDQELTVAVWDPTDTGAQPRGKQVLKQKITGAQVTTVKVPLAGLAGAPGRVD